MSVQAPRFCRTISFSGRKPLKVFRAKVSELFKSTFHGLANIFLILMILAFSFVFKIIFFCPILLSSSPLWEAFPYQGTLFCLGLKYSHRNLLRLRLSLNSWYCFLKVAVLVVELRSRVFFCSFCTEGPISSGYVSLLLSGLLYCNSFSFVFPESRLRDCRLVLRIQSRALMEINSAPKNPGIWRGSNNCPLKQRILRSED